MLIKTRLNVEIDLDIKQLGGLWKHGVDDPGKIHIRATAFDSDSYDVGEFSHETQRSSNTTEFILELLPLIQNINIMHVNVQHTADTPEQFDTAGSHLDQVRSNARY